MNYISYQCSVCRRKKDLPEDSQRALLNHCIITKGCLGRLFAVGEGSTLAPTPRVAGLQDWFARGTEFVTRPVTSTETIDLSTSANGALTLGIFLTEAERNALGAIDDPLEVTLAARRVDNIAFTQFNYRINSVPATVVSGADQTGITMRFDQPAINEARVQVRVNGIIKFEAVDYTLTPNVVTFLAPLALADQVSVSVFDKQNTTTHVVNFTRNDDYAGIDVSAWRNVKYAENGLFDAPDDSRQRLVIWTADEQKFTGLPLSSRLRLLTIGTLTPAEISTRAFFLLAAAPYGPPDRNLSIVAACQPMQEQFILSVSRTDASKIILVDYSAKYELFPPLQLLYEPLPDNSTFGSSYRVPADEMSSAAASSAIINDTTQTALTGRVIGPT